MQVAVAARLTQSYRTWLQSVFANKSDVLSFIAEFFIHSADAAIRRIIGNCIASQDQRNYVRKRDVPMGGTLISV